ncbi:1,2-dihydroxy-3-keto-5-methylthiopentene dioxygenase [Minicystis rosea]|nr:1,2-dihydroxy-3-keto-5-methylthiopentene dioxygenase [Minicystis rosea]
MSLVRVYPSDTDPSTFHDATTLEDIRAALAPAGIRFERWRAATELASDATQDAILAAYAESVAALKRASGFATTDVIRVHPETPNHAELRKKFLAEHAHSEDEARFFVEGAGLFTIHHERAVYGILCEAGDLINVPAGIPHWFDMGPRPRFTSIRLFTSPEGWVARFTGSDIADRFPRLGERGLA